MQKDRRLLRRFLGCLRVRTNKLYLEHIYFGVACGTSGGKPGGTGKRVYSFILISST